MKRRDFIQRSTLAAAGTLFVPTFLRASQTQLQQNSPNIDGKRLIIIQLTGGNDGLNTTIPFRNDIYYKNRPTIAIAANDVLRLSDEMGWNPALEALHPLYDNGEISIINSVGYPNPDRSHFRSMDIWHTASDSDEYFSTGWLGRYLDKACDNCAQPHFALEVNEVLSLALKGNTRNGFAMSDAQQLQNLVQTPVIKTLVQHHHQHTHAENVAYLYRTLLDTNASADYLAQQSKATNSSTTYPNHNFGKDLQQVAKLIAGGSDTQIYYISLEGFDTHANQKSQQERLLRIYAEGVAALTKDLKNAGAWNDTLVLTFSEFGRRVAENGSNGTDHGTANQVFLAGGSLRQAGFYNAAPNLETLDEGDLLHEIDFRRIYATVLQNWLNVQGEAVLNGKFATLPIV